jgi:hypothetical protein
MSVLRLSESVSKQMSVLRLSESVSKQMSVLKLTESVSKQMSVLRPAERSTHLKFSNYSEKKNQAMTQLTLDTGKMEKNIGKISDSFVIILCSGRFTFFCYCCLICL